MKKLLQISANAILLVCFWVSHLPAQTTYYYPLNSNFNEATGSSLPLVELPNDLGQTGSFVTNTMPSCSCAGVGQFSGYEYPINAGVRFDVPAGFISCEYSVQFTWRYDNPGGSQEWIRMLSFIYTDDSGLDIWTQPPGTSGGMYYWHLDPFITSPFCLSTPALGNFGSLTYFNDCQYYQITLTRACNDVLSIYANGVLLGTFPDVNQRYMPKAPSNHIVFFRDTVDTSCYPTAFGGESSSGFIKDLEVSDYVYTPAKIATDFLSFCPSILPISWQNIEAHATGQTNLLEWSIEPMEFIERFEVERSEDGSDFQRIGTINVFQEPGMFSGDVNFNDRHPTSPRHYYRIKAIDLDGNIHTSPIKEILSDVVIQAYPNPAQDFVIIDVPSEVAGSQFELIDSKGRMVKKGQLKSGRNRISLMEVGVGIYLIKLQSGQSIQILKER